ncbi:MAG: cardiolipin synthase ClsB [Ideonella sp. MAG2]|nr:MAG: cardiolipin synthase ClsB [Ideonella sp. MAG2]
MALPRPLPQARTPHTLTAWRSGEPLRWCGGNQVHLLRGGDALFPAMMEAIAQAQHSVWLATYIFHDDAQAELLAQALAAAAARGVDVKVVVDGFGSNRSLERVQAWLLPAGVALAVFRPLTRWWNWLQPGQLRRLHQKLCVVDDALGFVGGINVIGDRLDMNHGPTEQPRLDFAVAVQGPLVADISQATRSVWTRAAMGQQWRQEVQALWRGAEPLKAARQLWRDWRRISARRADAPQQAAAQPTRAALVVRDNLRQRRSIERAYIEAIAQARHRVDLVTPYFYPGQHFRRALIAAARRGAQVRLILQGKLDYRIAGMAARVLYDELLAEGVEIYEYMPAFLHAKVAVVDEAWATVGSSNIDPLSLLLNLEANVVVDDAGFAAEVSDAMAQARAESRQVLPSTYAAGPAAVLGRALVAWLAHWYLRMSGLSGRY